ncbi:MAG: hypothetical protein ACO25F_07335 [Erythrobacter sp.]
MKGYDLLSRTALGAAAALSLIVGPPAQAAASRDPGAAAFAQLTGDLDPPRRAQFCGYVAHNALEHSGNSPDPALRLNRAVAARQLSARLAPMLAKANAASSPDELQAIEGENGQMMGLLSYAPSDWIREQVEQGNAGEDDILGLFVTDVVQRCNAMLDKMKVPPAAPLSEAEAATPPPFTWDGDSAADIFADTALMPFTARLCTDGSATAADFAGAPLDERGKDGTSLLDWAIECGDKTGIAALLDAGFNASKPGAFGEMPLARAAKRKVPSILQVLLERGVSPNAIGKPRSALAEAYDPDVKGGGQNFRLLREAGAGLGFPSFDWSMWSTWTLYARWEEILANLGEFDSDPVSLGRTVSRELERDPPRASKAALEQIKARLIADFGVCFPIGALIDYPKDARGYYLQPDCPGKGAPQP